MESSLATDGVEVALRVDAGEATATRPRLTADAGPGSRSTARGEGTPASLDPAVAQVSRGDLITLDLIRTVGGSVTAEPRDVVVVIAIRNRGPE